MFIARHLKKKQTTFIKNFFKFHEKEVLVYRKQLFNHVSQLSPLVKQVVIDHYQKRINAADGNPMVGEYAAIFFADCLDINLSLSKAVSTPWMLMYAHSLLFDDLLDQPHFSKAKHQKIIADILLNEALKSFLDVSNANHITSFLTSYLDYREASLTFMASEFDNNSTARRVKSKNDFEKYVEQHGNKDALAHFLIDMMMLKNRGALASKGQHSAAYKIFCAIQILDDFDDLMSDHRQQSSNALLPSLYHWASGDKETCNYNSNQYKKMLKLSETELSVALVFSGVAQKAWGLTESLLRDAINIFYVNRETTLSIYLQNLIEQIQQVNSAVKDFRYQHNGIEKQVQKELRSGTSKLERLLETFPMQQRWRQVNKLIEIAPTARN